MKISEKDKDKLHTIVARLGDEIEMLDEISSTRSIAIAKTYMQTALMWLNRAIFREEKNEI